MANRLVSVDDLYDFPLPVRDRITSALVDPAVSGEATARADADTALDGRIDALEAVDPLTQAEGDARYHQLTTDLVTQVELDAEVTARTDADAALDTRLDSVESTLPAKADLVGGVVPTGQMPSISIMNRVSVADEAARLALINPDNVQIGDVAVQADTGTTWLLVDANPSLAGSWKAIDQSDAVSSVNGQTGTVVLGKADVGLGSVDNTSDLAKPVSAATQTALDTKAPIASPALTGTPTAPTAPAGTNTTQVATTAFVRGEVANGTSRAAKVTRTTAQSVANATNTAVSWDSEVFDEGSLWDVGAPTRYTIQEDGRAELTASVVYAAGTGQRYTELRKNGSTVVAQDNSNAVTGAATVANITAVESVVAGDYFEVIAAQNSGGALNVGGDVRTFFSVRTFPS